MESYLDKKIENLKGVGSARATLLQREIGIFTYGDLLSYYPFRYVDRTRFVPIREINETNSYLVIRGYITRLELLGTGRTQRLAATFSDSTGNMELVWFKGLKWIQDYLKKDVEYIVMGKPTFFNGKYSISHPDMEVLRPNDDAIKQTFMPIYSSTEKLRVQGFATKGISKLMRTLLVEVQGRVPETLPQAVLLSNGLISKAEAIKAIHFPDSNEMLQKAIYRLKFEELFFLQLDYQYAKKDRKERTSGFLFDTIGDGFNRFYKDYLPFSLTNAQKRVVKEIRADMKTGQQMNRLLQGDVGSGKTLVALLCMLIAKDNGFQSCMMAPTEILATQHYLSITKMLGDLPITTALLTGSTKAAEKRKIKQQLQNNEIDILIGTHALIEDDVKFFNLGFVVIDEQHRFGVEQRAKMWTKNQIPPHVLVMTATPIPRTLAMTFYGDLDCSIIDELPPGRKPIKTIHQYDSDRLKVFAFMERQMALGRQVYVVYPLIKESEKLDLKDLMDGYESISRRFPLPKYQISIVHGQMKPADKDFEMERFKQGKTHIMVSTTVIEVGVDVPNATVMVIENSERFGLAQLHQLRGRVGRGGEQSYCILMTADKLSFDGRERISTMVRTNDGFEISEADLKLRGPGDLQGLQQSGVIHLKIADIVKDESLIRLTRDIVTFILQQDPEMKMQDNYPLQLYLQKKNMALNWSKIS
ncbi:MAG: ATP-dependent DNA helicase RecG [Bacteroidales bacterium]|nr:ATP-dependent DNA helicase RecG [Bacteroidales bacterium]